MKRLRLFLANIGHSNSLMPQGVPPLGIMSLAAYLRTRFDMDIQLVNQRLDGCTDEQLAQQAVNFNADIVGFGAMTPFAHAFSALTKMVRQGLPDALIALGGPSVTAAGQAILEGTEANAAVPGEGELALEMIIRAWFENDKQLDAVPGIFRRDRQGNILSNPGSKPVLEDLDSLPFYAYDLIDLTKYWTRLQLSLVTHRPYASIMTSRGCPYQCIYCQHQHGRKFRSQSAERVVDEIEHYVKTYKITTVEIMDDVFNLDKQRVLEFNRLLAARNLKCHLMFPNGLRGDILTEPVMDALIDSGMDYVVVALETGSNRLQKLIGKNLNIEKLLKNIEYMAGRRRVFTHGFAMLGFPTETEEEMLLTLRVAAHSALHTTTFNSVITLPGTELYELAKRTMPEKMAHLDFRNMETCHANINVSNVPDDRFLAIRRKTQLYFYGRPGRLYRILRDHPNRKTLPKYLPPLIRRATKGLALWKGNHKVKDS